jgi:hypothetical protein
MTPRSILTTPHPVPSRRLPSMAGSLLILLALPVFAIAGWSLGAWGLAAALWAAGEVIAFALGRLPVSANNLVSSGFVGIAMTFRVIFVMAVLIAVATSNTSLALAAGVLYAAAYSVELAVSLLIYFGNET